MSRTETLPPAQTTATMVKTEPVPTPHRGPRSGKKILVFGATGTIGRATVTTLKARGYDVVCFIRPPPGNRKAPDWDKVTIRYGSVSDPASLRGEAFKGDVFDAVISCLASRTGAADDAWAIDHRANSDILRLARETGTQHFVMLSAICVQNPMLAFQHAKLAFEAELQASGLCYSIVRPTAYFKSLSGQLDRLRAGKPFLVFGDGTLTACKPISDRDLAGYIADCLENPDLRNKILPVGGPGPALTPREQGTLLFRHLGQAPRFRHVPVAMLDAITIGLSGLGRLFPSLRAKTELARIGRYYATQSMLVLDPASGRYDADATPSHGTDTLDAFYQALVRGEASIDRGAHAVF